MSVEHDNQLRMLVRNQKNRIDSLESRVAKLEGDHHKLWQQNFELMRSNQDIARGQSSQKMLERLLALLMSSMGNGLQGPQQLQLMPGQGFQRPPANQMMPYTIANAGQQQSEPGEAQIQELANSTAEIKRGIVEQKNEQSSLLSNRLGCLEERNLNAASSKKAKKER